jgi:predicted transcriptional regulator
MHGIFSAMKASARNFHVPLSAEVHEALRGEAERTGKPATALAREAIEAFLRRRRKIVLHEAISAYANARGGTADDLDPMLERAAIEHLLDDEDEV